MERNCEIEYEKIKETIVHWSYEFLNCAYVLKQHITYTHQELNSTTGTQTEPYIYNQIETYI